MCRLGHIQSGRQAELGLKFGIFLHQVFLAHAIANRRRGCPTLFAVFGERVGSASFAASMILIWVWARLRKLMDDWCRE
jgi:hypothetical protein